MDSYYSIKLILSPLNRSSVVNINSILQCHLSSNINERGRGGGGWGWRSINKGHFTAYVFKEDKIKLYDDEKNKI